MRAWSTAAILGAPACTEVAGERADPCHGVHLLAAHPNTLIGEAVMIATSGMTLEQVGGIHPHPTQTALFREFVRRLVSRLRRSESQKADA